MRYCLPELLNGLRRVDVQGGFVRLTDSALFSHAPTRWLYARCMPGNSSLDEQAYFLLLFIRRWRTRHPPTFGDCSFQKPSRRHSKGILSCGFGVVRVSLGHVRLPVRTIDRGPIRLRKFHALLRSLDKVRVCNVRTPENDSIRWLEGAGKRGIKILFRFLCSESRVDKQLLNGDQPVGLQGARRSQRSPLHPGRTRETLSTHRFYFLARWGP
jgi:hypothetical protein